MPNEATKSKSTLTLIGVVLGLCVSLVILWSALAKPAVTEAARVEAQTAAREVNKSLDYEIGERKADAVANAADHQRIEDRIDKRMERMEASLDELVQESRRHR